jgi:lipopolysaccharide export system protein LptC
MNTAQPANRLRTALVVLCLLVIALGSFWLLESLRREAGDVTAERRKGEPDYTVEQFSVVRMSVEGQARYSIAGTKLTHYPDTDFFDIEDPLIHSIDTHQVPMTIRARQATVEEDGSRVHMRRDVRLVRTATPDRAALDVTSEYLLFLPNQDIVRTDSAVEITTGRSRLSGVGMYANNRTREFRLLHDVQGFFEAPAPR